ncbi:MAG: hypothetical protein WAO41_02955 [Candidatus Nanopelagicales bacterium]
MELLNSLTNMDYLKKVSQARYEIEVGALFRHLRDLKNYHIQKINTSECAIESNLNKEALQSVVSALEFLEYKHLNDLGIYHG